MVTARILLNGQLETRTFASGNALWTFAQDTGAYVERYSGTDEPTDDEAREAAETALWRRADRAEGLADTDDDEALPAGYLLPMRGLEPCGACGELAPTYARADYPEFVETVCQCDVEGGHVCDQSRSTGRCDCSIGSDAVADAANFRDFGY